MAYYFNFIILLYIKQYIYVERIHLTSIIWLSNNVKQEYFGILYKFKTFTFDHCYVY